MSDTASETVADDSRETPVLPRHEMTPREIVAELDRHIGVHLIVRDLIVADHFVTRFFGIAMSSVHRWYSIVPRVHTGLQKDHRTDQKERAGDEYRRELIHELAFRLSARAGGSPPLPAQPGSPPRSPSCLP